MEILANKFDNPEKQCYFCRRNGQLAERRGIGLQNRVRRFESATDLVELLS